LESVRFNFKRRLANLADSSMRKVTDCLEWD